MYRTTAKLRSGLVTMGDLRLPYLEALGIDVWRERGAAAETIPVAARVARDDRGPAAKVAHDPGLAAGISDEIVATLDWDALRAAVSTCTRCSLHASRKQTVFGVGDINARLLVVGEAPGADEDRIGEPFVGRAGQLLNAMLRAIGLARESVFIANILKCRPPGNRDPKTEESQACSRFLNRQIALLQPQAVLALGRISAQWLLRSELPVGRLRGQMQTLDPWGLPLVVSYHPAYLLRSPAAKARAWQDLLLVRELLNRD
ncbi:MAG TPA: uracil-DNA glycosylase [Gammaproteobacteria bacterium]|nr:uracil-DNA glycosylase [Gammaproteobacteria bacterium]